MGLYKIKGSIGRRAGEGISQQKKWARMYFLVKGFYLADCLFFYRNYLIGLDQKIQDRLIKIMFLREFETANRYLI